MLDLLAFLVATAVHSVPEKEGADQAQATQAPAVQTESATAFLAPAPQAAPAENNATGGVAFLGGAEQEQPAAPAFLGAGSGTQTAAAGQAAPAFLAPSAGAGAAPTALVAEPQVPTGRFTTAVEIKPILSVTKANWINVREFNGEDLLYVTHLWAWRCGLLEMKVGVNGQAPEVWPLPVCHENEPAPNAIKEGDGLPYRNYGLGQVALVEIQLTYDDLSTETVKFNRQGMPLQ